MLHDSWVVRLIIYLQKHPHWPISHRDHHTSIRCERQMKLELRMTNGRLKKRVSQTTRQIWQWCHVCGHFCREQQQLCICIVDQELSHIIVHQIGPRGIHKLTGSDAKGIRGRYQHHRPTNGALHLHQRAQNYIAIWSRDRPNRKPLRQWRHATSRDPSTLAAITPGRHIGGPGRASAMTPRWDQRLQPSSVRGRPPSCLPPRSQLHALCDIPGLGAPKPRIQFVWHNHRGL